MMLCTMNIMHATPEANVISALTSPTPVDTTVSIVNIYPGPEVYELEGHTLLRIRMGYRDVAVSYGVFDFNAPNFVYRFVKGETDYRMAAMPWQSAETEYRAANRRMVEHVIELSSEQKKRLLSLLDENLRPENATYRYNYVKDNCATRPLRILEKAIGDSIILSESPEQFASFRQAMRFYHKNYPWYQFGIDMALGSGIDYPITNREMAFAPVVMDAQLDKATVAGRPLVLKTTVLNDTAPAAAVLSPTSWIFSPMAAALAVMALCVWCAVVTVRRRVVRWAYSLFFAVIGLAGALVWFLVFVSEHEATAPNALMFWLSPLMLIAAATVHLSSPVMRRITAVLLLAEGLATLILLTAWPLLTQCANPAFFPLMAATVIMAAAWLWTFRHPLSNPKPVKP